MSKSFNTKLKVRAAFWLLLLFVPFFAAAEEVLLWEPQANAPAPWHCRPADMKNQLGNHPILHDRKLWTVTFPKATAKESYPAVFVSGLIPENYLSFKYLTIRFRVPEGNGNFALNIRVKGKTKFARFSITAVDGENVFNIPTAEIGRELSGEGPKTLIVYLSKPVQFNMLALESVALGNRQAVARSASGPSGIIFSPSWSLGGLIWQGRPSSIQTEVIPWPDGVPGLGLKMTLPSVQTAKERYPAVIARRSLSGDWGAFNRLEFEVYSLEKENFELKMMIRGKSKDARFSFNIVPGRQKLTISRSAVLSQIGESVVREVHLYRANPQKKATFMIGDFVLVQSSVKERAAALGQLRQGWEELGNAPADLGKRISALDIQDHEFDEKFQQLKVALDKLMLQERVTQYRHAAEANRVAWSLASPLVTLKPDGEGLLTPPAGNYTICAARSESEGMILALFANEKQERVRFQISDLKSGSGKVFKGANISVAPIGYIKCGPTPYAPFQRDNYVPDPILSHLMEFTLPTGVFVSCFIDINVPEEQAPGEYHGTLELLRPDTTGIRIPLTVKVWDFSIHNQPGLFMAVSQREPYQPDALSSVYLNKPEERDLYREIMNSANIAPDKLSETLKNALSVRASLDEVLLSHRLPVDCLYRKSPPSAGEVQASRRIAPGIRLNFMYAGKKTPAALETYLQEHSREELDQFYYLYGFDEAYENEFPRIREILKECKSVAPGLPVMSTLYDLSFGEYSKLDGLVDYWVVPLDKYVVEHKRIKAVRNKKHTRIGYYTACGPFSPFPNLFIEYPRDEQRLLTGFTAQALESDCFLYYSLFQFGLPRMDKNGKWTISGFQKPIGSKVFTDYTAVSYRDFNGDGNLVYPGPDRILPSLRLKAVRDGLEDYIYVEMLKKSKPEKFKLLWPEIQALATPPFTSKTPPGKVLSLRLRIGELLSDAR